MTTADFSIGPSRGNRYSVKDGRVDISRSMRPAPDPFDLEAEPVDLMLDLARTALVVVDMQNDFCAAGGMVAERGGNYEKLRTPIAPINALIGWLRPRHVSIIWVNWGNRPDKRNLAPAILYTFNRTGKKGIGDRLDSRDSNILEKGSWSTAIVDELNADPGDVYVDKYRVSGFWDTPLDSILRQAGLTTLLFAGVNADQCVFATLQDAACLGYDTILLQDCVATTSPDYCMQATLYNAKITGFVSNARAFIGR